MVRRVDAWSDLYSTWYPTLLRYMRLRLPRGTPFDWEDLTSDVLLRAFENRLKFIPKDDTSFASWIYRIARNRLVDYFRTVSMEKKHTTLFSLDWSFEKHGIAHDGGIAAADTCMVLRPALDTLSLAQKRCIELRLLDDLTLKETGRVMGKSEEAIKQLQVRSLVRLRREIDRTVLWESRSN